MKKHEKAIARHKIICKFFFRSGGRISAPVCSGGDRSPTPCHRPRAHAARPSEKVILSLSKFSRFQTPLTPAASWAQTTETAHAPDALVDACVYTIRFTGVRTASRITRSQENIAPTRTQQRAEVPDALFSKVGIEYLPAVSMTEPRLSLEGSTTRRRAGNSLTRYPSVRYFNRTF